MNERDTELFQDANQDIDVRVEDLLARMNLDEKLAQIGCVWSTRLVEDEAQRTRLASLESWCLNGRAIDGQ